MNRPKEPDISLNELLAEIPNGRDDDLDTLIMDAVLRCNLLSWGRKGGGSQREMIPQFAWEMGKFDHRTGKLIYRHPDSPLPEEYDDIAFRRAELEPWLRELASERHKNR